MELLTVVIAALGGAFLSFFCGFGLGTILLPCFMIFFPPHVAVAATAVVHMLNNVFKLFLVGKHADWTIIRSFGLLSVAGSLLGAWLLYALSDIHETVHFHIASMQVTTKPINLLMGLLMIVFALFEIIPRFQVIKLSPALLPFGGLISGFFGGLSGHQGALRSAFLMKAGLSKEAFMGTRVVCACLVDITRISVYASQIRGGWSDVEPWIIGSAALAAFSGSWFGNRYMKKTELRWINLIVSVSLIVFGILLITGIVH